MSQLGKLIFGDRSDPSEQLLELFGEGHGEVVPNAVGPAITWGHGVINAAGIAPDQQLLTIKALREAEPCLDLRPATHLAKLLLIA